MFYSTHSTKSKHISCVLTTNIMTILILSLLNQFITLNRNRDPGLKHFAGVIYLSYSFTSNLRDNKASSPNIMSKSYNFISSADFLLINLTVLTRATVNSS